MSDSELVAWIKWKFDLPEDAPASDVTGAMHVAIAHRNSYQKHINEFPRWVGVDESHPALNSRVQFSHPDLDKPTMVTFELIWSHRDELHYRTDEGREFRANTYKQGSWLDGIPTPPNGEAE